MTDKKPLLSHTWKVKTFKQFAEEKIKKEVPKILQKKKLHSNEK